MSSSSVGLLHFWSHCVIISPDSQHAVQAVREAVRIPVLANGNIRNLEDVHDCLAYTGAVGVMSAESLLEDPALFSEHRLTPEGEKFHMQLH